ncbi:MAG: serine hydrolase, partial [Nannocystaceae bacterium]
MRRLLLLSCLSLACATNSTAEGPAQPLGDTTQSQQTTDPRAARMDALSARIDAKRQELGIPGLALVVVKDGQVLLSRGFGERNVADKQAVDEDTLFAIGSTTKAFTA